jgi:hypothetical protein
MGFGLLGIATVTSFAYTSFQTYKPYIPQRTSEVKSFQTSKFAYSIPYIEGAKELGVSDTSSGRQITLEVEKSFKEVLGFYSNVLAQMGWKGVSSTEYNGYVVNEYTREDMRLTISISEEQDGELTIIGINLADKN